MGNSSSGLSRAGSQGGLDDEDDLTESDDFRDSILTVPDEVPVRRRLALHLKSDKKTVKGVSMQSALSVDMENPEAEQIKRNFEKYMTNKENEINNIQNSEKRVLAENKRLRAELQALQVNPCLW